LAEHQALLPLIRCGGYLHVGAHRRVVRCHQIDIGFAGLARQGTRTGRQGCQQQNSRQQGTNGHSLFSTLSSLPELKMAPKISFTRPGVTTDSGLTKTCGSSVLPFTVKSAATSASCEPVKSLPTSGMDPTILFNPSTGMMLPL